MDVKRSLENDSSRTPIWFLGTGAFLLTIFFILFISEFDLTLPPGDNPSSELRKVLRQYHFLLTPLLVVVAGSLGAYSLLTRNFVTRIVARGRRSEPRSSGEKRDPALLYLIVGGLFGFLGGLVIPSALLVRGADLTVFNPASLAVLSALSGFVIVQSYSPFIDRIADELSNARWEINTDQVAEAVQKALGPPPLVNFDGYLACTIRTRSGPAMDGERAYVPASETHLVADLTLTQSKPESGASTRILVNQGIDPAQASSEAVFVVEVASADVETPDTGELAISQGTARTTIPLKVAADAADAEEIELAFYVSQSGRHIASMRLPISRTPPNAGFKS